MRKVGSEAIKKVMRPLLAPLTRRLQESIDLSRANNEKMIQLEAELNKMIGTHDFRLDELRSKVALVENYQPTYGIAGVVSTPARQSADRARVIHAAMGDVAGMRVLDIGSSLGYMSFYLADRGAVVTGWEVSPQNAEVARLIGGINGVPVSFVTKELTQETASEIQDNQFDVVIVLSVFHHILRFQGLEATQAMIKTLFEKSPVMIVELAKKGEDPKLPWDKYQPDDELEIFKGLDVTIKKLGTFGNHLSSNKRPLYIVEAKKTVSVNEKKYAYHSKNTVAYAGSPLGYAIPSKRRYYFTNEYVIKEYGLQTPAEKVQNLPEAYVEMGTLNSLTKLSKNGVLSKEYPELIDAEISSKTSRLVIGKFEGVLLSDLAAKELTQVKKNTVVKTVLTQVIGYLNELAELGLSHNDIRSWNIIYDELAKKAYLIDFGDVSRVPESNDLLQLIWALYDFIVGSRQTPDSLDELPPRVAIEQYPELLDVYDQYRKGLRDPRELKTTRVR